MALLRDVFKFEPETIEECHVRTPVPKLRRFPDYTFTAINGVARGDDGVLHFQPLKVFSTPTQIVTVLGPTHQALDTVQLTGALAHRGAGRFRRVPAHKRESGRRRHPQGDAREPAGSRR